MTLITETSPDTWWDEPLGEAESSAAYSPAAVTCAADIYNRYPGEKVALYIRVTIRETISDLVLTVRLPVGLILENYWRLHQQGTDAIYVNGDSRANRLIWRLNGELPADTQYEYQLTATVAPTYRNKELESHISLSSNNGRVMGQETVTINVFAKGKYLRYLPALYEQDNFMGRFLMLFESFWSPIESQINDIHYYLDPRITPVSFLPWLAAWLDLSLDKNWSEAQLRQLIRWAIALHRSRGTKWGLLKYLEIYTGQKADIIEHRAKNFVLGSDTRIGPGIALGLGNVPHTFSVRLRLPALDIEDEQERSRQEKLRRRTIESIIEMQKPAHTVYTLYLETVSASDLETQTTASDIQPDDKKIIDEIAAQAETWFKLE